MQCILTLCYLFNPFWRKINLNEHKKYYIKIQIEARVGNISGKGQCISFLDFTTSWMA